MTAFGSRLGSRASPRFVLAALGERVGELRAVNTLRPTLEDFVASLGSYELDQERRSVVTVESAVRLRSASESLHRVRVCSS